MSDLVGNPEARFSRIEAHLIDSKPKSTLETMKAMQSSEIKVLDTAKEVVSHKFQELPDAKITKKCHY